MRHPRIGKQTSLTIEATEEDSAAAVGNVEVDVVATTALILFLEAAAAELIDDCCEPGEISVGSAVNVRHLAAAPIGARIQATAKVTAVQGRRIDFAVEAHHGRKTLMTGTHQRVVVNQERFMKQHGLAAERT
ncbi:MAG TPA: thioesterase family protein [Candidatus Angelobacter sp.]|nr:thioesterase family protein [Candidatus Angelobacter sp.]